MKKLIIITAFGLLMLVPIESISQITISFKAKVTDFCRSNGKGCSGTIVIDLPPEKSINMAVPKGASIAIIQCDKWDTDNTEFPEDLTFSSSQTKKSYGIRIPAQEMVYSKKHNGFIGFIYKE